MAKMSADEKRWRAESDAATMARYQEILNDPARKRAAVAEAQRQAKDLNRRAAAMNSVANTRGNTTKRKK